MKKNVSILLFFVLPLLYGCIKPLAHDNSIIKEMDATLTAIEQTDDNVDNNIAVDNIPVAVSDELLPSLFVKMDQDSQVNLDPRFDVIVHDISAEEFFLGLFKGTPYSVALAPEITGKITLSLRSVTIKDVLKTVRDVYGYDYRPVPGGYMILPSTMRTKIFQVDYLNINRKGSSNTTISLGHLTNDDQKEGTTSSLNTSNEISGSEVSTTIKADFWQELQTTLLSIVGTEKGRKVVISPQTGVVAVHALPAELYTVEQFILNMQENLGRQVLLEAKILEVELNDGYQSGVNWAGLVSMGTNKSVVFGQTGRSGEIFDSTDNVVRSNNPGEGKFSQVELDTGAFGGLLTLAFNLNDFTSVIELLETQGSVRVLSSPRISTINNQKAVIKVGTDEFFVTDVGTVTTTGTSATTEQDVDLTPFFSGISLDVTPQINNKGEVILHVHPSVVDVTDDSKILPISSTAVPLAKSSVRESDSIVIAKNSQIVVIGGLMKTVHKENEASTPVLSNLPIIGGMFRQERVSVKNLELVILIRPTVIKSSQQWKSNLRQSMKRIDKINFD